MHIYILAAGKGSRLFPLTETKPKCLLDVRGQSILQRQIASLLAAGAGKRDITVIGGYRFEALRAAMPAGVGALRNPEFERCNNIYTITLPPAGTGPVAILNGDCVCHPAIYEAFLGTAHDIPGSPIYYNSATRPPTVGVTAAYRFGGAASR